MADDKLVLDPANPTLASVEEEQNARTGAQARVEWEGTEAQCQAKKLYAISIGASAANIKSVGNGWWVCQAEFPFGFDGLVTDYGEVPSVHELQTVVAQISIYRSTKLRTLLTGAQIGIVARVIDEFRNGQYSSAKGDADAQITAAEAVITAKIPAGAAQTNALALFEQVTQLGMEDVTEFRQVYRRTLTAATPDQVKASFVGVGKIWTTAEVMDWEGINPDGWFTLDPGMQWLKSKPDVIAATGAKTQIVYNYTECLIASGLAYSAQGAATLLYRL